MPDLGDHNADLGDHDRSIPVITMDRSGCSRSSETRRQQTDFRLGGRLVTAAERAKRTRLRRLLRRLEEQIVPGRWDAKLSMDIDRVTVALQALGAAPARPVRGQGRSA